MKLSLKKVSTFAQTVRRAVELAEVIYEDYEKAGPQKREFVVVLLNKKIDLPFLTERIETYIFGLIVDVVVELWLNSDD